ncbi:MAG TPA: FAD/NAD(P)-binding oxidoreductase [Nocardioidaceae bacterium]|nr:FAD/NAD(P)-binding oxidoreductase [Nocardioidaceae bacterium]
MTAPIVVVGAGLTAGKAVEGLREAGHDGPVIVYGDETLPPYERPPLSKSYLAGGSTLADATVHEQSWYDEHGIELRLGSKVQELDVAGNRVVTQSGSQEFSKLLLATGAAPRRLGLADRSDAPVTYLRAVGDSDRIRGALVEGARIAVIGGGWIGLEVAATARQAGAEVTVVESFDLPLLRVLGHEVAKVFAELHREHGVDLRLGAQVTEIERRGKLGAVHLMDGTVLEADLMVVGIGALPNTGLAERAGLPIENGVVVDEHLRTSHPDVYAAGDVASAWHPVLGTRIRVEHWDNAIGQGTLAGRNLAGREEVYDRLPYFYTDQYDFGMEYLGHVGPEGYDEVVLQGDPHGSRQFRAFWLRDDVVLAGMHANDWDAMDPIRSVVGRPADRGRLSGDQPLAG